MRKPFDITQRLQDWSNGDQTSFDKLMPLVYEELGRQACVTCKMSDRDTLCIQMG